MPHCSEHPGYIYPRGGTCPKCNEEHASARALRREGEAIARSAALWRKAFLVVAATIVDDLEDDGHTLRVDGKPVDPLQAAAYVCTELSAERAEQKR